MADSSNDEKLHRREFLTRCTKAGLAIAATGLVGYQCYDPSGPERWPVSQEEVFMPDFSIPEMGQRMSIVRGSDRVKTVQVAFRSLGGMEAFVKPGDRVLLKVNAAFASPPMLSATTHPQLTEEVARLCLSAGAAKVLVTDNPINDPASCFALTGTDMAARSAGARVLLPGDGSFRPMTLPKGKLIKDWPVLYEPLKDVNKVIGMAPVKDHHRSGASMSLKNGYGLLGGRRNIFHQDIHNIIKELAMMFRPTLVILDGTVSMMHNGPTGGSLSDLKETHTMIVSTDPVAADAFGATLLDKTSDDLPFIAKAEAEGVGTADYRSLNPEMLSTG